MQILHADSSLSYSDTRYISSEVQANGFLLFPNPAKNNIYVYLNEYTQPVIMIIYNSSGEKILEKTLFNQNSNIELPIAKGLDIVEICNIGGGSKVRKKLVVM